ncbi:MAG: hypothetical protein OHK0013_43370 [Sandaracinaceae bacterium]
MRSHRHSGPAFAALVAVLCFDVGLALAQDASAPSDTATSATPVDAPTPAGESQVAPAEDTVPTPQRAAQATVPATARQVVVVDAITYGIAPVVGRVTSDQLRRSAAAMGYTLLPQAEGVRAFRGLRLSYPPAPADLWRLGWATRSHRALFARVWANEGRYVIEVIVASIDGTGPFVATETSGADDLRAAVDRAVRQALPPPTTWQGPEPSFGAPSGQARLAGGAAVVGTVVPQARRRTVREELGHPTARDGRRWRPAEPDIRRFSVALQTEASIGTTEGSFYNHYVGLRLDVRITRDILVGLYGAYVNLDGRDGRVHDFFFMLQAEDRIRPSSTLELTIPLRLGIGYLPFNGPVFRLAAGLHYPLTPNWEVGVDLVAPTFYVLPDRFAVAFDFALEVGYRF